MLLLAWSNAYFETGPQLRPAMVARYRETKRSPHPTQASGSQMPMV